MVSHMPPVMAARMKPSETRTELLEFCPLMVLVGVAVEVGEE